MLKKEFDYYLKHQTEFANEHPGEFVVIKGEEVLGYYKSEAQAFEVTARSYRPGTYLIEPCILGSAHYTARINSRVSFGH